MPCHGSENWSMPAGGPAVKRPVMVTASSSTEPCRADGALLLCEGIRNSGGDKFYRGSDGVNVVRFLDARMS